MLKGKMKDTEKHVKFISYTGKYPNLCSGILTLEIDGNTVTFGSKYLAKGNKTKEPDFNKFWESGGSTDWRKNAVEESEWVIDIDRLPGQYKKYAYEIDIVFNANVEHGCCGGCL